VVGLTIDHPAGGQPWRVVSRRGLALTVRDLESFMIMIMIC
jgi:hypothetical protein